MQKNNKLIAILAFGMYFITGAACVVVGSGLPHLVERYEMALDKVVLLGSAYAIGRVATAYFTGRMVEKFGPLKVLAAGVILVSVFLLGLAAVPNYYAGLCFACLGGIGMGAQDTVCPVMLSFVFKKNYAGSLSAGQALFGLGNFSTPFLVGVLLSGGKPFYFAYYILLAASIVMLVLIPFAKMDKNKDAKAQEEERVIPLYVKKPLPAYGAMLIICAAYSAALNVLMLYTSTFAESLGISPASSAFMLTAFNVGCVAGSSAFVLILRKVKSQTVLLMNNIVAGVAITIALLINKVRVYFIALFVAGFFMGVLFSVIIEIATRIGYKHISVASSLVATASGASDILTPIITGFLVARLGIGIAFKYALIMMGLSIVAALVLKACTTEKYIESEIKEA